MNTSLEKAKSQTKTSFFKSKMRINKKIPIAFMSWNELFAHFAKNVGHFYSINVHDPFQ